MTVRSCPAPGLRWFVPVAVVAALLPLLWPAIPPLGDLPGHIARYRILADAGDGPLGRHYAIDWALIGNLGVDLLVLALHPLIDVEPATRIVVMAIPLATMLAMLWLGYEAQGQIAPATGFALPLAYGYPFQLGFVNFTLSAALALAGLALWIRLARTRPRRLRIALFAPIACLVWLCHSFGWAMLGLFVFGAEWQLRRTAGRTRIGAAADAVVACLPMALPLAPMLLGHARLSGHTGDWFNLGAKAQFAVSILRERWKWWDVASAALLYALLWGAVRSPKMRFSPLLAVPAALGIAAFVVLPRFYQGGAYVDMRMLPVALAVGLLGMRIVPAASPLASGIAWGGMAFLAVRTIGTTAAFVLFAQGQAAELPAIGALRAGGATLALVAEPAATDWSGPRRGHLAGLATARARVFTNEQWALPGQQLTRPRHPLAAPFDRDPSQLIFPLDSPLHVLDLDGAIAAFDRCTFDRVWTIGFPIGRVHAAGLHPIWRNARSAVYRVDQRRCLSERGSPP